MLACCSCPSSGEGELPVAARLPLPVAARPGVDPPPLRPLAVAGRPPVRFSSRPPSSPAVFVPVRAARPRVRCGPAAARRILHRPPSRPSFTGDVACLPARRLRVAGRRRGHLLPPPRAVCARAAPVRWPPSRPPPSSPSRPSARCSCACACCCFSAAAHPCLPVICGSTLGLQVCWAAGRPFELFCSILLLLSVCCCCCCL